MILLGRIEVSFEGGHPLVLEDSGAGCIEFHNELATKNEPEPEQEFYLGPQR